jgi:prepilin-type processing-associated H-X9-DG protein
VREKGRQASCQSNLKQIGLAFMQYTADYDNRIPAYYMDGKSWIALLLPYAKNGQVFNCPSDRYISSTHKPPWNGSATSEWWYVSYGANVLLYWNITGPASHHAPNLDQFMNPDPTNLIMVTDCNNYIADPKSVVSTANGGSAPQLRHNETANVLFFDGHVKAWKEDKFKETITGGTLYVFDQGGVYTLSSARTSWKYWGWHDAFSTQGSRDP